MKAVAMMLGSLMRLLPASLAAATVEYNFSLARQERDFTSHAVEAMTIHGQLPRATLRFTEGDRAAIRAHNRMRRHQDQHADDRASPRVHWLFCLPNETQDSDL